MGTQWEMHNLVPNESLELSWAERTFLLYDTRLYHSRPGTAKRRIDSLGKGC